MRLQLAYWQLGGGKAINEIKIQLLLLLPFCYSSANSDIGRRRRQQTLPMNFSIQVGRVLRLVGAETKQVSFGQQLSTGGGCGARE